MSADEGSTEELIPFDELADYVSGLDPAYLVAALRAGLIGPCEEAGVPRLGVQHFVNFGTQWRVELGRRQFPAEEIPVPPGIGGEQPLGTVTQLKINSDKDALDAPDDQHWIAQYYLRPNRWCWAPATESALIGPIPLKLPHKTPVPGVRFPTYLCPDPSGRLAMIMVFGAGNVEDEAPTVAYDIVHPILAEAAFRSDVPLPIAHALHVGVPSGTVYLEFAKPPKTEDLVNLKMIRPDRQPAELLAAKALYWDGVSSANPFHQFLTFWRVYENVVAERSKWRKRERRSTTELRPERMPDVWVWRGRKGATFDMVRQSMREAYRNAIAHANPLKGPVRSPATAKERSSVAAQIPAARYMARTVLQNFEATLMSDPGPDVA